MSILTSRIDFLPEVPELAAAGCGAAGPHILGARDIHVLSDLTDHELAIESDRPIVIIPVADCKRILSKIAPYFKAEYLGVSRSGGVCYKLLTQRELLEVDYFSLLFRSCRFVETQRQRKDIFIDHAKDSIEIARGAPPPFVKIPASLFPNPTLAATNPKIEFSGLSKEACLEWERKILEESLKEYPGICLGEAHTDASPKFFLIQHMKHLKALGVKILYVEFALVDIHQRALESYNQSDKDAPMPAILEERLRAIDQGQFLHLGARFSDVFRAAHEEGIEIVAIDSERSYSFFEGKDKKIADERVVQMNRDSLAVIGRRNASLKEGEKYLIYCGHAHSVQRNFPSGNFAEPGLAQMLKIPALRLQDITSKASQDPTASITLNERNKLLLGSGISASASIPEEYYCHFTIQRPEVFGIDAMTALEKTIWNDYLVANEAYTDMWKQKKDGRAIDPALIASTIEHMQRQLLELYRHSHHTFIESKVRALIANLKTLREGKVSDLDHEPGALRDGLKEKKWSSSQAFCVGYYDMEQAEKICSALNARAPEGISFAKELLTGYIEGGVCSALCVEFLIEVFNRRVLCSPSHQENFFRYLGSFQTSWRQNAVSTRAIQAAMNTIVKSGTDTPGSSERNIRALFSVGGFSISSSSAVFDLNDDAVKADVIAAIRSLPEGCTVLRAVQPESSIKGEAHGHTMVFIRNGNTLAIYDPNKGVQLFSGDIDKSSAAIFNLIFDAHLTFNVPKLQMHYIDDNVRLEASCPLFFIDSAAEISSLSRKELLSLSEEKRYYFLKYAKQIKELQKKGLSFATLAACPLHILPHLLTMPTSVAFTILPKLQSFSEYTLKCFILAPELAVKMIEYRFPLTFLEFDGYLELLEKEDICVDGIVSLFKQGYSTRSIKSLSLHGLDRLKDCRARLQEAGYDVEKLYTKKFEALVGYASAGGYDFEHIRWIIDSKFPIEQLETHQIYCFLQYYPLFCNLHSKSSEEGSFDWKKLFTWNYMHFFSKKDFVELDVDFIESLLSLGVDFYPLQYHSYEQLASLSEHTAELRSLLSAKDLLPERMPGEIDTTSIVVFLSNNPGYNYEKACGSIALLRERVLSGELDAKDIKLMPEPLFFAALLDVEHLDEYIALSKIESASSIFHTDHATIAKIVSILKNRRLFESLLKIDRNLFLLFTHGDPFRSHRLDLIELDSICQDVSAIGRQVLTLPKPFILALADAQSEGADHKVEKNSEGNYILVPPEFNDVQKAILQLHDRLQRRGIDPFLFSELDPTWITVISNHQETFLALIDFGIDIEKLKEETAIEAIAAYASESCIWRALTAIKSAEEVGTCKKSDFLSLSVPTLCEYLKAVVST